MKQTWVICLMLAGSALPVLADWESEADARIDLHRKAGMTVKVLDLAGNSVSNAEVVVEMQNHAFPFGTAVNAGVLNQSDANPAAVTYRAKILENFNAVTLENAHKWTAWEEDSEPADLATQWSVDNELEIRGHACIWQYDNRVPSDVFNAKERALAALDAGGNPDPSDSALISSRSINHTTDICEAYKEEIFDWDVINENRSHHDYTAAVNPEAHFTEAPLMVDWLNAADVAVPGGDLFVNDYNILVQNSPSPDAVTTYQQMISYLLTSNAPLDGIGFQSHYRFEDRRLSTTELWDRLETFDSYGLKLRVTEFDMGEESGWTDAQEADWLHQFYKICFSHPSMTGITMWGFTDKYHPTDHAPLYDNNWNLKPAGLAYQDLVFSDWWTDNSADPTSERLTGEDGAISLSGFKGDYKITVYSDTYTNTFFQALESDLHIEVSGTNVVVTETNVTVVVPLVTYDMQTSGSRTIASYEHSDITAGSLMGNELNSAPGTLENPSGDFYTTWSPDTGGGSTVADALAVNSYVSLTVVPAGGKLIRLGTLSFNVFAATSGSSARQLYVLSDKTGFSEFDVLLTASTVSGDPLIPYNSSPGQHFSIDLAGNSAFSNITDSVTFRFYIQTPNAGQSLAFDDILLLGSSSSISSEVGDISITVDDSLVILSWEANAWDHYGVQTNADLIDGPWGHTHSNLTGVSGTLFATNILQHESFLFYRVILDD